MNRIRTHRDLEVYKLAYNTALEIYELSKTFPKEEMYSLTSQIRKSSRSVTANIAEAFRKRRYPKAFISKLSDAEAEAAETQVWLDYSKDHKYLHSETANSINLKYESIISMLIRMISNPNHWSI